MYQETEPATFKEYVAKLTKTDDKIRIRKEEVKNDKQSQKHSQFAAYSTPYNPTTNGTSNVSNRTTPSTSATASNPSSNPSVPYNNASRYTSTTPLTTS